MTSVPAMTAPDPDHVAVVVTSYEPDQRLRLLVDVLCRWPGPVIVVDDGSSAPIDPGPEVEWVRHPHTLGVAAALNSGLRSARAAGATHVVTFDQDSLVDQHFLPDLVEAWRNAPAVGLAPGVVAPRDPGDVRYRGHRAGRYLRTTEVVQSGAMFSLAHLAEIDDFQESLVIDGVDTQACVRLAERGYDVLCVDLAFEHQLGEARGLDLGSRRVLITGHPPNRHYYMTRNRLLLVREHALRRPGWAIATVRKTVVAAALTALFDEDRAHKVPAIGRGVRDAVRGRRGPISARRAPSRRP